MQALIDRFNEESKVGVQVRLREMRADSGQHLDQFDAEFQSGEINIDVIGANVIWPARFAANGFMQGQVKEVIEKAGSSGLRGACARGDLTSGAGRSPEALSPRRSGGASRSGIPVRARTRALATG